MLDFLLPSVTDNFKSSTGRAKGKFPFGFVNTVHIFLFLFLLTMPCSQAGGRTRQKKLRCPPQSTARNLSSDLRWQMVFQSNQCLKWTDTYKKKRSCPRDSGWSLSFKSICLTYSSHAILEHSQLSVTFRGFAVQLRTVQCG